MFHALTRATFIAAFAFIPLADAKDQALLDLATKEAPSLVATLEKLVNIETGSTNAKGMEAMGQFLTLEFQRIGATVTRAKPTIASSVGENLIAQWKGAGTGKVLMIAHMDTVYAEGTLAKAPFRIDGNRAFGPGIADDKGGIATIIHAVKVLQARKFNQFDTITVMINTDEERGSFGSADLIRKLAGEHDLTLSFEPTVALREMLTLGTAGVANIDVIVKGRAAHAGANPEQGVNALLEAADFALRTSDLDDKANDFRFNYTLGKAGTVANMIPPEATISANVRFYDQARLDSAIKTLRERAATPKFKDSVIEVKQTSSRPSFVADAKSKALVDKALAVYKEIGHEMIVIPKVGGGTDAAFAAQSGKPVLEGLGLPGFGYHSDQAEYVNIEAIPRRLYLAVRLIEDGALGK
jgi:glutamate carboxypeptidase